MTKTEHLSRPASGSFDGNSRPLGEAMRFCMIRAPRRAWLVGLGLAVGIILAAGGSASADQRPPPCSSLANPPSVFKILDNQTYALCAVASCLVFNGVAYCDAHAPDLVGRYEAVASRHLSETGPSAKSRR